MADTRMDDDVSSDTEDGEEGMARGTTNLTQELQGKEIASKGAAGADKLKRRIVKASRMPELPEEHRKIIVRPRGGRNLIKVSTTALGEEMVEAARLTEDQAKGDIVSPNFTQNTVLVSTPDSDHAESAGDVVCKIQGRIIYALPKESSAVKITPQVTRLASSGVK
ncbi:hypothetical protein HPB49_000055 [Dermacentor silvarum]|uniref:Uncharacterized protein n=1 Tax=Dermacentor silvarum TaxID=543639 RepID=A0ACB8CCE1_DERSI|nr:hypothetical protein HPB49_000055 [Dermacentor silvarum]